MEKTRSPFASKRAMGVLLFVLLFHALSCDAETFGNSVGAIPSKEMSVTEWDVSYHPTADSPHDADGHHDEQRFGCLVYELSPVTDGFSWSSVPLVVKGIPHYRPLFDRSLFNPPKPLSA
ncbi:MAG: hypothetical protein ACK4Z6_02230 [Candidatus Methylomirabilales bacterium]